MVFSTVEVPQKTELVSVSPYEPNNVGMAQEFKLLKVTFIAQQRDAAVLECRMEVL